jgi:ppGpp synthetase/RelA/SpoT-type nucleotidyltranferase
VSAAPPTDYKGVLAAFRDLHPKYDEARQLAQSSIDDARAAANLKTWLVDGRTKTVSSFMKKAFFRPEKRYDDPIGQIQDIAGVRVIVPDLRAERIANEMVRRTLADAGFAFIKEENKRHEASDTELAYRGRHLMFERQDADGLSCEVQLHTRAESVWSEATHDIVYKPIIPLPPGYPRKLTRLVALVEMIDEEIDIVQEKVAEHPAVKILERIEAPFAELSHRDAGDWDRHMSVQILDALREAELVTVEGVDGLVQSFVDQHRQKLEELYADHGDDGSVLLASQPESLVLVPLLAHQQHMLRTTADLPEDLLRQLAEAWAIPFD